MELDGKIAVVTGAAQGIGASISRVLCKEKAVVVMIDISGEKLEKEAALIQETGGVAVWKICDITDLETVNAKVKEIVSEYGRIDILVNNAGITRDGLSIRVKNEDWNKVIDVNLTGTLNITRAVVRNMLKQRAGKIINITSIVGLTGNIGQISYSTSKAGLIGFTKTLAREVAKRGICVNAIAPGYIQTSMTDSLDDDIKAQFMDKIPLNRLGSPRDVANLVLFLSSSFSDYITGEVIRVDGGMAM